jgi:non-specific serine/threonine protein kinase
VWTIDYDNKRLHLRDAKGVQYIAQLLRCEGRELHAAELAAGSEVAATSAAARDGETMRGLGNAGDVLDAQARGEYRQRLRDLQEEAEEATRWGDAGRAGKLREEIEFLTDEIAAAVGLGGRARKAGDVADRARKAVTSRIRETIERIGREHPVLGRHLENAIRTGLFCSYQPDRSPGWET